MRADAPVIITDNRPVCRGPRLSEREEQNILCWVKDVNVGGAPWMKLTSWIDLRTECCVSNKGSESLSVALSALRNCLSGESNTYRHWLVVIEDPTIKPSEWKQHVRGAPLLRKLTKHRIGAYR